MTDALLQEARWVRRLAFSLAANPHDVADLEQDIWYAALAHKGTAPDSVRGWLTGTARKLAAFRARTAARARAREAAAAAPEVVLDDAAALAARQELHKKLLAAVDGLPDAMREAVLLRYFEGLAPREIAARLGVSVNTVLTRLQRGRERLRAELDRVYDRRAAWTALALVDWRHGAIGATASGGVAPPLAAFLLMSTNKTVLAGLAALLVCIPIWFGLAAGNSAGERPVEEPIAQQPRARSTPEPGALAGTSVDADTARTTVGQTASREPLGPPPAGMGRVVDMDGEPIEAAAVRFGAFTSLDGAMWPARATRQTDAEGLFALPPESARYLHPVHAEYVADRRFDRVDRDGPTVLQMRRVFTTPVTVTLRDEATGEPVPRFTVTARSFWNETDPTRETGQPRLFSSPDELDCRDGRFTGDARFVAGAARWFIALECPGMEPPRAGDDTAYHQARQQARAALRRHVEPVPDQQIRLDFAIDLGAWERRATNGVFRGAVIAAATRKPIAGVAVRVQADGDPEPLRVVQTDARGTFAIVKPAAGAAATLSFSHPDYAGQSIPGTSLGATPIALEPRASLTLTVLDEDGAPMVEQACRIVDAQAAARTGPEPLLTDGHGIVRRERVEPGRYFVLVLDGGPQANDDRPLATASFTVAAGEAAEHTIRVGTGGAQVTGRILGENGRPMDDSRGSVSVHFISQAAAGPMVRSERGTAPDAYRAENVPPGDYLVMIQVDRGDEIVALLPDIEVRSMAATTIDLQVPAAEIRGRITGVRDPSSLRVSGLPEVPAGSTAAGMLGIPEARRALSREVAADGSFSVPRTADGEWVLEILADVDDGVRSGRTGTVIATRTVTVRGGCQLGDWTIPE